MNIGNDRAPGNALRVVLLPFATLLVLGLIRSESAEQSFAYVIVLTAALLPTVLWLRMGVGLPVLAAVSLAYIPFYAWPILSGSQADLMYRKQDVMRCAITVGSFLLAATALWRLVTGRARPKQPATTAPVDQARVLRLVWISLIVGTAFHAAVITGMLSWLGPFFGLVRSIAITLATIACFLVGVARAGGALRGRTWAMTIAGVGLLLMLTWSSLFLLGGLIYILALGFGFVIVARRVPWRWVVVALAAATVLHAGKADMRAKYWAPDSNYTQRLSLTQLPSMSAAWVIDGFTALATGGTDENFLQRASLLQMVLRVEAMTPDTIDYLRGGTYTLLPRVLVPRFVNTDKPASQMGMDLLNVRYGILTASDAAVTAVGWGLIAEAFANFGYLGVLGVGLLLGFFCGVLSKWSDGAPIVSIPMLASISMMMVLINLEADSLTLCSTLFQSFISVLIAYALYRWFSIRRDVSVVATHAVAPHVQPFA